MELKDKSCLDLKRDIVSKIDITTEAQRGNGVQFDRIRRITGYLTGTLDTWGGAKRAEEHDRVKHIK